MEAYPRYVGPQRREAFPYLDFGVGSGEVCH